MWRHATAGLRRAIAAAVVAIPLLMWENASVEMRGRVLATAQADMQRVSATQAEQATRLFEA